MTKIRKFRKEDAGKVSDIIITNQRKIFCKDYPKKAIDFMCKHRSPSRLIKEVSKKRELFVAVEKERILGICGIKNNEITKIRENEFSGYQSRCSTFSIKTFFVSLRYHRKGIGKKMLEFIEVLARKKKIKKLTVLASLYAEGFYKKYGFKKIRIKTFEPSKGVTFDVIVMEKKI